MTRAARLSTGMMLGVAGLLAALVIGYATVRLPMEALALAVLLLVAGTIAIGRLAALVGILVLSLPWLVVLGNLLPALFKTFWAAAATLAIIAYVAPRIPATRLGFLFRLGFVCFFAPQVIDFARSAGYQQFIQVAKYMIFPSMVLAVAFGTRTAGLARLRRTLIASATLSALVQLGLAAAGLGSSGSRQLGQEIGFGGAHDVSLLMSCVAAAAIAEAMPFVSRLVAVGLASVAAIVTGVRSGLLGLALAAVVSIGAGRLRPSRLAIVGAAVAAVFLSPAADIVLKRFHYSQKVGEFTTFANYGSGRGAIWSNSLRYFANANPFDWLFGTGLRSILHITQQAVGASVVGQNDVIDVVVQLGVIGLFGLLVLWVVLIRTTVRRLPLVVLASFGFTNGSLEYLAPLVVALVLVASDRGALSPAPEPSERRGLQPFRTITGRA